MQDKKLKETTKDWDVDAIVKAIIDDDPERAGDADDLRKSLHQTKSGHIARKTTLSKNGEKLLQEAIDDFEQGRVSRFDSLEAFLKPNAVTVRSMVDAERGDVEIIEPSKK